MDNPLNFHCTAPIQSENSGGPLVDDERRLGGIAVASLNKITVANATGRIPENMNVGIHLDVIRRFLRDNHITLPTADTQQGRLPRTGETIAAHTRLEFASPLAEAVPR
jgi:S1-C subfamily serine protease